MLNDVDSPLSCDCPYQHAYHAARVRLSSAKKRVFIQKNLFTLDIKNNHLYMSSKQTRQSLDSSNLSSSGSNKVQRRSSSVRPISKVALSSKRLSLNPNASRNEHKRAASPSATRNTEKALQAIANLQLSVNNLPVPQPKIIELSDYLSKLKEITGQTSRGLSRASKDFWTIWEQFTNAINALTADQTPSRTGAICKNKIRKIVENINHLRDAPPAEQYARESYLSDINQILERIDDLQNKVVETFAKNDTQEILVSSRLLIKPFAQFSESISKEFVSLFAASVLPHNESSSLKTNTIHTCDMILQSLRGLRDSSLIRDKISEEVNEAERIFTEQLPPVSSKNDASPNTLKSKNDLKKMAMKNKKLQKEYEQAQRLTENETESIQAEINDLKKKDQTQQEIEELKKHVETLQAEKEDILALIAQASQDLNDIQDDEARKAPVLSGEDIVALTHEGQRLRDELALLKAERRKLEDEMVKARATNFVLSSKLPNAEEYAQNSELRLTKISLMNQLQSLKEEILLQKSFRSKASHLNILPTTDEKTENQLISQYKQGVRTNELLQNQRKALQESLLATQKRRDELVFSNLAKISTETAEQIEQNLLAELEQVSDDYHNEKLRALKEQQRQQANALQLLRYQTDLEIMSLRKTAANNAKLNKNNKSSPRQSKVQNEKLRQDAAEESRKEIEIMEKEIHALEQHNQDVTQWVDEMRADACEYKAKSAAFQKQISILNSKIKNNKVDVDAALQEEIEKVSSENQKLRMEYDNAMWQLKELDVLMGGEDDEDLTQEERFASIEEKMNAFVAAARGGEDAVRNGVRKISRSLSKQKSADDL